MDYFSFYDLPISFSPDEAFIKAKFYELSKKYHPDFFINEPSERQQEVLELSTLNNKAYQVLRDPQKRLQYILELKDQIYEGEQYVLPQSFLMDMMDINEALMELEFDPDPSRMQELKNKVSDVETELMKDLNGLTSRFDALESSDDAELLAAIKDLYYRNKYLLRIKQSLEKSH